MPGRWQNLPWVSSRYGRKRETASLLRVRRDNLLGKLAGVSEYDIRRPLTPTGTNLLGLVKHVASVELGYFGEVLGGSADDTSLGLEGTLRLDRGCRPSCVQHRIAFPGPEHAR